MVHTHLCHFESHSNRIWKDSYCYDGSLMQSQQNFRLLVPLAAKLGRLLRVWSAVFVTLWRFRGTTRIILMQLPHSQTRTEFMGWRSLSSRCLCFQEVFKEKSLRFAITSSIQGVDLQMTKGSRCHLVYVSATWSAWWHLDSLKHVELKRMFKVARTCEGEVISEYAQVGL